MKKILVSLLALALLMTTLGLVSCGDNKGVTLDDYVDALAATNPSGAELSISVETLIGTLYGTVDASYNEDGSSEISYTYEKFNEIGAGEEKSRIEGTVTCDKDGNLSGSLTGSIAAAASLKLNISESLLDELDITDGVCSAVIKAQNTEKVFGINLGADVRLVIYKNDKTVNTFSVAYRNEEGAVSIVCEYK